MVLPVRPDGTRYNRYSDAVADLAPPRVFQNRGTYRLTSADLTGDHPALGFGHGSYFDSIDLGDAAGHEYTATALGDAPPGGTGLRDSVGDPCDPAARRVNVAISALTLRHDPAATHATLVLHRRDATAVGHAGGLYQVLPVGVFQPAGDEPWNTANDFSLWRCLVREYAEELLGQDENHGTDRAPLDYDTWPFAADLTRALHAGQIRAYCVGMGVDPLTYATDLLTVVVFDAAVYDDLFGGIVEANDEGAVIAAQPFTADVVDRFAWHEPTQAAGAALLLRAWQHRTHLLP